MISLERRALESSNFVCRHFWLYQILAYSDKAPIRRPTFSDDKTNANFFSLGYSDLHTKVSNNRPKRVHAIDMGRCCTFTQNFRLNVAHCCFRLNVFHIHICNTQCMHNHCSLEAVESDVLYQSLCTWEINPLDGLFDLVQILSFQLINSCLPNAATSCNRYCMNYNTIQYNTIKVLVPSHT